MTSRPSPPKALSDGLQSLDLPGLAVLVREVGALAAFLAGRPKNHPGPVPDAAPPEETSGEEAAP